MNIVIISDIEENEFQQKRNGVQCYAISLYTFLKNCNEHQVQLYNTKINSRFFAFLHMLFRKDMNTLLAQMPIYFPFKRFSQSAIIHLTSQTYAISLAWQKPKQPVILTVHDIIPYVFNQYNSIWERLLYIFVIKGIKNATHIITDSEHTKKDIMFFLKIPEEKISVIHLGVDPVIFSPLTHTINKKIQRQENTVLYVGSETKRKNLSVLLRAIAEVKKQIPDIKLIKVGVCENKKEHAKLQELANKLHITENILWKGYVENIADEYRAATVFVLPSLYEGFGFPVIESMACGCPVICSDKTSLPEIAQNAVLYFDGYDHTLLAQHIYSVLTDKMIHKQLQKKGLRHIRSFMWEECIKLTEDVYRRFSISKS